MRIEPKIITTHRDRPDQAIQLLELSGPFERWASFFVNCVRGLAHLGLRAANEAAGELQKILDHRGENPTGYFWALAHLGSARAAALTDDTANCRKMYEAFLLLWKDTDPDILILIPPVSLPPLLFPLACPR